MKKLLTIILLLALAFPLISQEAFKSAGRTAVRQDTTFGSKAFGRLITTKADTLLWLGDGFALKQVGTWGDTMAFMKLKVDTLTGFSNDSIFVNDDFVLLKNILFEATSSNSSYWTDASGDTIYVINPNAAPILDLDYTEAGNAADGTRYIDNLVTMSADPAASAEVNAGYFALNKSGGSNGTYTLNGLEGVVRSQYADEAMTARGVYGRFYIDPTASATLRTGIGGEFSARAGYSGGEIAAENGTAFIGTRIWMAPYFTDGTFSNINNSHALWILNETPNNSGAKYIDRAITVDATTYGSAFNYNFYSDCGKYYQHLNGATAGSGLVAGERSTASGDDWMTVIADDYRTLTAGQTYRAGYFRNNIRSTTPSNPVAEVTGLECVAGSYINDEALTFRGLHARTYVNADATSSMRTNIGADISARASYSGGTECVVDGPPAGTAFVGARIWMAPYFTSGSLQYLNNFWGLWIYGEHASQRNGDAAIKINDAGGGWKNGLDIDGPYTGDVIDFSGVSINHTGSNGPCLIRAGTYASPIDYSTDEDQSGMIRLYSTTSAGGTSYDRGIFSCQKTTNTKGVFPIAGLAEVNAVASGDGPTKVQAGQFISHLNSATAKLAALGGDATAGMYGLWAKVTANDGAITASGSRVAPIWLDNQLYGAGINAGTEEYTIFSTTGGSIPDAWAGFETSSVGWDQLFHFDETAYDQAPVSNTDFLKVLLNSSQYYIPLSSTNDAWTTDGAIAATDTIVSSAGIRSEGLVYGKGKAVFRDSLRIGQETVADNKVPTIVEKYDADSDVSAVTPEKITRTLTPATDPTNAIYDITGTQLKGWRYDNRMFGIGSASCTALNTGLDISYGYNTMSLGADNNAWTRTDNTIKVAFVGAFHYDNEASPLCIFQTQVGTPATSTSRLRIGGGVGSAYSFSNIHFYTCTNNTTVTGTEAMMINSSQNVGIGTSSPVANSLTLGTKGTQRDLVTTRENTPAKTDSCVVITVDDGNGKLDLKAGDADSLVLTTSSALATVKSNNPVSVIADNNATRFLHVVSLLDEGEYVMPTGIAGFGQCKATLAWVFFHFESDGTVTLEDHVNGSTTDGNDTTLNVYDAGDGIVIENQLGGTLNVLIDITYYTP